MRGHAPFSSNSRAAGGDISLFRSKAVSGELCCEKEKCPLGGCHRSNERTPRHAHDQHGTVASGDPWCAACRPRAGRRDGRLVPAGFGLPPSRHGEDRREPHVPAVHSLYRPDGLSEPARGERRLRARGRRAPGHRGPAAMPSHSRHLLRAGEDRLAPRVARDLRARSRRGDNVLPHVQGPGVALRPRRGSLRRASDDVLHARGRRGVRRHAGLAEARARVRRCDARPHRRLRVAPHQATRSGSSARKESAG